MSAFMHSAVSFGTPDMPPPGVGSSIAPISLHNAIRNRPKSLGSACGVALQTAVKAILTHYGFLKMPKSTVGALLTAGFSGHDPHRMMHMCGLDEGPV
jgi:hypothetical protein